MKLIPYGHQCIDDRDIAEVAKVLKSGWITQGPKIKEFEEALCRYAGAKYGVALSNGTAALHIACLAAGISSGDEVITSPLTFAASANCILYCGGSPVFADILGGSANIDPEEIKRKITKRTKAIIPVHYSGLPCDMKEMASIARANNLTVIEDAAHALGARYKNSRIGSCRYSDMATFSFHPVKSITTGEGGAVLTNDKTLYEKLLALRNHGIIRNIRAQAPWHYEMRSLGFNYRITDIQCALGISQMKKLDRFIARRRQIAGTYIKAFKDNAYFDIPDDNTLDSSSCHLFTIRLKDDFIGRKKDAFLRMREKGLGVQTHYIPVYLHPYYEGLGFRKGECPAAEDYYARSISIPIYPALKDGDVRRVIKSIFDVFEELGSR